MTRPSSVPSKIINDTNKNSPRGKSSQGEVSISPNFSTSGLRDFFFRMGWLPVVTISEPIFLTLVWAFYSRATYGLGGPVLSIVRGVEIRLSPESICSFSTFLQLDFECMRPRRGPLCRDSSLERLFRGCVDSQMPRGWANHRHTA